LRLETAAEALLRENRRKHNAAVGAAVKSPVSRFVDELHKTLIRLFTYVAVLGGLGFAVAAWLIDVPTINTGDRSEHRSEWIETSRPQPAFAMEAGEFSSAPRYMIQRHPGGGGRKDVLSWGEPLGPERHLRIEIYRPGTEHDGSAEPELEAMLRAGALPMQGEARSVGSLPTKLGTFSVVELSGGAQGGRRCLGFVRAFAELPLQIAGWHCDAGPAATVRTSIACALDQLTLLAAGGDARLAGLFARADQKRTFCGDKRPSLSTAPKRTDWLDVPAEPKLRGRVAMR
jgi:hypothetical protein